MAQALTWALAGPPPALRAAAPGVARRSVLASIGAWALSACAAPPDPAPAWARRLSGDTVALLGEVHDNAALHGLRLAGLRAAVQAGWRPLIAMEQFDTDCQAGIDLARRERPLDADHLIARATSGRAGGWDWRHYRPLVELALAHGLPLVAANLPRGQARLLARGGWSAAFGDEARAGLGLEGPLPARLQAAQEKAVGDGHCGALPASLLPGMARAQLARDAVMAQALRGPALARPGQGAVLIAGNGHVRRDQGVPAWLVHVAPGLRADRLWAVGFIEPPEGPPPAGLYDAWVRAPAVDRPDPCEVLTGALAPAPAPE